MSNPCYPVIEPVGSAFRAVRTAVRHKAGVAHVHHVHHGVGLHAHLPAAHAPVVHAQVHPVMTVVRPPVVAPNCTLAPGPLPAGPGLGGPVKGVATPLIDGRAYPATGLGGGGAAGRSAVAVGSTGVGSTAVGSTGATGGLAGLVGSTKAALVAGSLFAGVAGAGLAATATYLEQTRAFNPLVSAPSASAAPLMAGPATLPALDDIPASTGPDASPSVTIRDTAFAVPEPGGLLTFVLGGVATILLRRRVRLA